MLFVQTILALLIFWSLSYLLNTFLLECSYSSLAYAKFLHKSGLTINLFQIKWFTLKCNRLFIKISSWKSNFWKWWFNIGVIVAIFGQFASVCLLCYTLVDFFRPRRSQEEKILVPVIPGVNLPSNQTGYFFFTLFVCGIIHEFGHAIAASREHVRVNGFGIFLMFMFPGAYVDLFTDHVMVISSLRQLRIFCAGIWHNLVLVILAAACLKVHPYIVQSLFQRQPHVASILDNSPLQTMLEENAIIKSVANCQIDSVFSWYECLYDLELNTNQPGYCMSLNDIFTMASNTNLRKNFTSLNECCEDANDPANYCFKWISSPIVKEHYACLPARFTTNKPICMKDSDCLTNRHDMMSKLDHHNDDDQVCIRPVWDNSTGKLIRIVHDKGPPLLYVGSVRELLYSVQIEDLKPRLAFIPKFLNRQFQLLLKYFVAFSGALAILNLVPCYAFDGQFILKALMSRNHNRHRLIEIEPEISHPHLFKFLMLFGTSLLAINIFLAFFSLAFSRDT